MEFSLVVLLFVTLLYALISFGMILATKQRVTNAAAEAARAAVGATDATAAGLAETRIVSLLEPSNGRYTVGPASGPQLAPCTTGGSSTGPQCITVTITYNLDTHPIVPPAPLVNKLLPKKLTSTASVQYR